MTEGREVTGKKKHGEVAFPTQVRYDIVFLIRPIVIIAALPKILQGICHIRKSYEKHPVVHYLTHFSSQYQAGVLRICTRVLRFSTHCGGIKHFFVFVWVTQTAACAPKGTFG